MKFSLTAICFTTLWVNASSLQLSPAQRALSSTSASKNSRFEYVDGRRKKTFAGPKMFLGGSKNSKIGSDVKTEKVCADTTSIGNLVVPSMGVGTISWSSKSCK